MSRSRVTWVEPYTSAANPPTTTKSTLASQSRCSSWLRITTKLSSCPLEFQCKHQRLVVEENPLLVRIRKIGIDQREIKACALSLFYGARTCRHRVTIAPPTVGRNCPSSRAKENGPVRDSAL